MHDGITFPEGNKFAGLNVVISMYHNPVRKGVIIDYGTDINADEKVKVLKKTLETKFLTATYGFKQDDKEEFNFHQQMAYGYTHRGKNELTAEQLLEGVTNYLESLGGISFNHSRKERTLKAIDAAEAIASATQSGLPSEAITSTSPGAFTARTQDSLERELSTIGLNPEQISKVRIIIEREAEKAKRKRGAEPDRPF